jgi:sporadic carbohydrate cluster protein (TIGR04323 family)
LPRPFFGYNVPIAIQSCFLRDYASKNNLDFSLPVTEIVKEDCYYMFKKKFIKKLFHIGMTSIFMLPLNKDDLFKKTLKGIHKDSVFHFVLENLKLKKKDLIIWKNEFSSYSKLSIDYNEYVSH